ncbi:anthranilate phosphoribosyltransferase [Kitasatospora aureofaciens]|uniref:Anthranilate phosphoribosyltransferase n=1 Tax=Kitasatospora aureofaciens TaxID=1894 RepID=A0A8H9HIE1_KITAU|nr:anthranilate phosphoribosyltransferase [Kitasatospora aureofaciens]QEV01959.1 anthranilate phosphoribosyltransferase [Streptomyces viridifaciens]UKZ08426.1 anthranilate phosphoribosyltransferase [Streptomyces viridifaciens]GGU61285.1 anthranilate phosphoribosyltransferase 1 [Kitasatospora aureofaciens]HJD83196.1 anthranilate phosphoribosyltransferase [Kitasatospora aureofaciens]
MVNVNPANGGTDPAQVVRTWPDLLAALLKGEDLDRSSTAWAMDRIMSGEASPVQVAGFMVALRAKGETVDEIAGLVDAMYEHAEPLDIPGPAVDIVGTGGDRAKTVNISTMSAIVAAAAGAKVVKHGNRAASSSSGSSDVLEKLGVALDLSARRVAEVAEEVGLTFCFAAKFHPSMRHAATARRDLGVPTAFNILGPLTNPAKVTSHAIGCFDTRLAGLIAGVLARRGATALVFRGDDGLDELTITTTSRVWVVRDGVVTETVFDPRDVGIELVGIEALRGADAAYNAEVARRMLAGERGPVRDAVLLNTAAALVAMDLGDAPLAEQLAAGMARAAEAIDSGAAQELLRRWSEATSRI